MSVRPPGGLLALAAAAVASLAGCDALPDARPDHPPSPGEPVPVLRVVDGDTVRVMWRGRDTSVRLIGIDAPEVARDGMPGECHGAAAERALAELLRGGIVRLELDEDPTDRFGRTLAYVYTNDGTFVNASLVEAGAARARTYSPNDRYQADLRQAQERARRAGRGLWSACA